MMSLLLLVTFQKPVELVTKAEFLAVVTKVEEAIAEVITIKIPGLPKVGKGVATRVEIINRFYIWHRSVKPKYKHTPTFISFDAKLLTLKSSKLDELIRWGFVGRVAPLATSKAVGLPPAEFGDTLGYFLSRLADLTHAPTSKFSPFLMPPP